MDTSQLKEKTRLYSDLAIWAGHLRMDIESDFNLLISGVIPSNTVGLIYSGFAPIELTIGGPVGHKKPRAVVMQDPDGFQEIGNIALAAKHHLQISQENLEDQRSKREKLDTLLKSIGPEEITIPSRSMVKQELEDTEMRIDFCEGKVKWARDLQPTGERLQIIGSSAVVLTIVDPHVAVRLPPDFPNKRIMGQDLEVVGKPPDNPRTLIYVRTGHEKLSISYPAPRQN